MMGSCICSAWLFPRLSAGAGVVFGVVTGACVQQQQQQQQNIEVCRRIMAMIMAAAEIACSFVCLFVQLALPLQQQAAAFVHKCSGLLAAAVSVSESVVLRVLRSSAVKLACNVPGQTC
jgi:hypothetical protein